MNPNLSKNINTKIIVAGYGWSGSSAFIDLLSEFSGVTIVKEEFRTIKDPFGILDLENALIDNWDPLNIDQAIKNFWWLAKIQNRKNHKFFRVGHSYNKTINKRFLDITKNYLDDLVDFKYFGHWFYLDYRLSIFKMFAKKVFKYSCLKIFKNKLCIEKNIMFFSSISRDEFHKKTREYIDELFDETIKIEKSRYFVLDQAIPVQNPYKALNYFDKPKVIIIDRDPRDIYVDLKTVSILIGNELNINNDVEKFIKWHKSYRSKSSSELDLKHNILRLNFEDLIYNYDSTVEKIALYLDIDVNNHTNRMTCFNPNLSIKNTKKWEKLSNSNEIKLIEQELENYLYLYEK
jgi:hypothetical protein